MTEYNGVINNFIQGVSQQPYIQRLEGQVEEQINCISSITDGLIRRPGLEILIDTYTPKNEDTQYYIYNRGDGKEQYLFVITEGILKVYDLLVPENSIDVTQPSNTMAYMNTDLLKLATVGDTTFVCNTSKSVTSSGSLEPPTGYQYLIHAKKASYGNEYKVYLKGAIGVQVPAAIVKLDSTLNLDISEDSSEVDKSLTLNTESDVIHPLHFQLSSYIHTHISESITVQRKGSCIYIASDTPLDINTYDGNGNTELFCIHDEVDSFDDLPNTAQDGYKVKVVGKDTSGWNDYYVKFVSDTDSMFDKGRWKETVAWNIDTVIDAETMPHKIVRESDGSFTVSPIEWINRDAGDELTNPMPSFVGKEIEDIIMYQDRLVLATSDTVCASCTSDYYNFFSPSVVESSDSDPIDVTSSGNKVTDIRDMLVFNGNLVITGKENQFFHSSEIPFDNKHFGLVPKAHYNNNLFCVPAVSATNVYFPFNYGKYTGIRKLNINNLTGDIQGTNITNYVNNYIEGQCKQIEISSDYNMLFTLTENSSDLFVYQWYTRDNRLMQQAWHKWEFSELTDILYIKIVNNILYILGTPKVGLGFVVLKINLQAPVQDYSDIYLHLDYLVNLSATENETYDVDLPAYYTSRDITDIAVVVSNQFEEAGNLLEADVDYTLVGNTLKINKSGLTAIDTPLIFLVGKPYVSSCTITKPQVRDTAGKAKRINTLRYKTFYITLENTGYIDFNINKNGTITKETFNSKLIGTDLIQGNITLKDYLFKIPIRVREDSCTFQFYSDKHSPFRVVSLEWSGTYREKGRRTV